MSKPLETSVSYGKVSLPLQTLSVLKPMDVYGHGFIEMTDLVLRRIFIWTDISPILGGFKATNSLQFCS